MASRIPRTILSLRSTLPRVQVIPTRTFATLPTATATRPALRVTTPFVGRFKSTERSVWAKEPIISYEELKPITQQPNDDVLIVDVREPDEVSLGSIPSSVNLPLSELKDALSPNFGEGDFKKKFAFNKPLPSQNIIFFCRSGKRSASAAEQAGKNGYGNVRNYQGSWLDWQKREKESGDDY